MVDVPEVVFIGDEFSSMSDAEYAAALAAWIAERAESAPIEVPISAAEVLRAVRCDTGS